MEDSFTHNMENSFTYNMETSFTNYIENSYTWNTLESYTRDTFSNHMDNMLINDVMQMNTLASSVVTSLKPIGLIKSNPKLLAFLALCPISSVQLNVSNWTCPITTLLASIGVNKGIGADKGIGVDNGIGVDKGIGVDNGIKVDKGIGVDNSIGVDKGIGIDCTESNVNSYKANQGTTNFVNHMDNENSCEIFSWDLLADFLQAVFHMNYSYMIRHMIKLPSYYTHEGFEVQQFKANVFINILTVEGIKEWFAAFEEHSKTTMPQTKGYGVKGKRVIFRESRHCIHSQIVRKKQDDPERKNPESARNRNTAESLGFRRVNEEIRDKFIQMFHDGHSPASALYNHEDELHLSASSSEKLVKNLDDRAINPGYKYVMHFFEHYRHGQAILQEYDSRIGKAFILCIVTGLMSRVHEKICEAGEICYVDASASFEPLNTSITLLYTSCIAGALPLGLLITFDELEMTIENAINLLKLILPEHAFFGRGCNIGPQNVLTDDLASERNAIKLC
ncbi:hypothetical protein C2G38_2191885 [Gigaspora rosea]|uniref:Uncharacterized protein n=1 Tax=Gigaspora rosea TaxID=44941 RepID=A0A397UZI8_9GLOM|nr:hypothetical protein C2G38_2191885 [Gigaspora rosea]